MSFGKISFLLLVCMIAGCRLFGQSASSPFSTFGIGERYSNVLANNQGMAGIGVSTPQFWYANTANPALLVYNNLTVFHAGLVLEQRTISSDTLTEKTNGGNLNYLVLAFPVKRNRWTSGVSISPYTTVNYNLKSYEGTTVNDETFEELQQGTGGLSQLSWSNGVRLTQSMAVGLKASYLFGSIQNLFQNRSLTSTQPGNLYATIEERTYVRDFIFSAGFSFSKDSLFARNKYRLSFGAVYDFSGALKTRTRTELYRTNTAGTGGQKFDAYTASTNKNTITLPGGFTTGISLSKGKWSIGTEFSYSDWSDFRSVSQDDEGLKQSWRIAAGGETTPDIYSENYLKRVTYRLGASFEELPYLANNQKVNDLGINFGLSLPAGSSSLDLGFNYGKRGSRADNLLGENYFRIFFGVTLNDQWFIKRKFD